MAKKDEPRAIVRKIEKPLIRMNALFNELMDTVTGNGTNPRDKELQTLSNQIDDVIFDEIKTLTRFTGDDISMFLVKTFNEYDNQNQREVRSIEDIFQGDGTGAKSFLDERYRNNNYVFEDLNQICSQLYELREALYATRDAIVTADDLTQDVSRSIKIKNSSKEDNDTQSYISLIENVEKRFGLLKKLKDHIIPNTLQYGKYYVYTVPYAKLFQQHYDRNQNAQQFGKVMEGVSDDFVKEFRKEVNMESTTIVNNNQIKESFNSIMGNIEICTEDVAIPLLENDELSGLTDERFMSQIKKFTRDKKTSVPKSDTTAFADGTVDTSGKKDKKADFSTAIKDCYIKLIDPRRIIPVKILDYTLGYYYIHQTDLEVSKSPFTTNIKFNAQQNPKEVETAFLTRITDKIVKSFDQKFLEKNTKFKELILNSLIYNDVYKKQLKFQFIPVDYITEFAVNRDEDGNGTSILYPSLFYAKLYLSLLIFKMITVISRSNDTKVYYIKNSGIDQNVANKVQEIARSIKERQINLNDLLNYNSIVSKVGHAKDLFMPVGRAGERAIDFDVIAGQDVQMNTDFMEMLRTASINSTGVPSVIMNYVNEADYAKTLVMANAKFNGRIVSHQIDINPSISDMYRKILTFATEMPEEIIEEVEFALSAPKALNNMNLSDLITSTDQTIAFFIKAMTGENASPSDDDNVLKDIFYKKAAQDILTSVQWNRLEVLYEEAKLELQKRKTEKAPEDATS